MSTPAELWANWAWPGFPPVGPIGPELHELAVLPTEDTWQEEDEDAPWMQWRISTLPRLLHL
uniref:Uncharacterized protein n=1 Tax=Oryza meridionalis TaxID=40149 RepID=A0A0E0EQY3_9ORYZ